jgi:hypothetical protein
MRLLIWWFPALAILAAVVTAADRPADAPEATSQPAAKPGPAGVTEARALLARAIAAPPKLTDAKTKRIKELIVKLGDPVWKVRQAASSELIKSGPEILGLLFEAADHKDLEISDRVSVAIKAIQASVEDVGSDLSPAIDKLAAIQDKKLIDMLLQLLDHSSVLRRYNAEYALRRITGKNFGFSAHDEPPARVRALTKWRKWWEDSKAKFSYDQAGIKARSLVFLITNDGAKTVTAVTLQGKTVWSKVMRTGVYCATATDNGNMIVGYRSGAKTVEEYNQQGKAVWAAPNAPDRIGVFDITRLSNGNTLIAYANNHCVIEINAKGKVVWQTIGLKCPTSAQRLANGNTLIADYSAARVVEVDVRGKIVWQKAGLSKPADAVMLPNGNVLIGEAPNRVLEVNRAGKIVWQRKCPARVTSLCSLPDGTIAITNQAEGAILLGRDGKKIRQLLVLKGSSGMWSKIRLVPSTVLTYK